MDSEYLQRMLALSAQREAETAAAVALLPCRTAADGDADEDRAGACESARAFDGCAFNRDAAVCPARRLLAVAGEAEMRLSRAGVPVRERDLILAAARGRTRLRRTDALARVRLAIEEQAPALLVLAGPRGVGKTLAACYALAKVGGRYLTAYQFARPGLDLDELKGQRLIVVDQLGRENVGASEFFLSSLEELIDARYANRSPTILAGNLTTEMFAMRYGGILEDRLRGDGEFVALTGTSMRGAL